MRRLRGLLPATVSSDYIYIKLFKNMPRSDVEMIFPNTKVRFRLFDKIKFGVTAGSGVGMGVFGTVGKIAIASNPYTLAAAVAGLGGVALRQATTFINQRNALHGGAGAEPLFPRHGRQPGRHDAAGRPRRRGGHQGGDAALQRARQGARSTSATCARSTRRSSSTSTTTFGIDVDFDVDDALQRLKAGRHRRPSCPTARSRRLPPHEAALHIDKLWDACLDNLPDIVVEEGRETEGDGDRASVR